MALPAGGQDGPTPPPPAVRSLGRDAFALPEIHVHRGCSLVLPRPPALRLPLVATAPAVVAIDLLGRSPAVKSFRFTPPAAAAAPPCRRAAVARAPGDEPAAPPRRARARTA